MSQQEPEPAKSRLDRVDVTEGRAMPFDEYSLVPSPRSIRKLAVFVGVGLVGLFVILLVSPWRQNIAASGRVVAFDPLDRMQSIPSPVTGRLTHLHVQEGSVVQEGALLIELADLDPEYVDRLKQQVAFARRKVEAAYDTVGLFTRQLELLDVERGQKIAMAEAEFAMAQDKVRAEEQELLAAIADSDQKDADRERRESLFAKKLVSELDFQKAVAAAATAKAKVSAVRAKVAQVRSERRAKEVKVQQIANATQVKIESTRGSREGTRAKLAAAEKELTEAQTKFLRQSTQVINAPCDGVVLRVHGAAQASFVRMGEPLIDFVPTTQELAVELWVRGNDAPLISKDREVRLHFEGWPAVQFAGWPSVAVGTFGGRVHVVDSHDDGMGRFRVLVVPDPADDPWPDLFFARQGTRANGWVLLDEVRLGYEVWRQLNAFPPSLRSMPGDLGPNAAGVKKAEGKASNDGK